MNSILYLVLTLSVLYLMCKLRDATATGHRCHGHTQAQSLLERYILSTGYSEKSLSTRRVLTIARLVTRGCSKLLELLGGAEHVRQAVLARYSGLLGGSESTGRENV